MTPSARQLLLMAQAIAPPDSPDGSEGTVLTTLSVPDSACHLLGRDASGLLAVLIPIDTRFPLGPIPPVQLESISVSHAATCVVSCSDQPPASGTFTVVRCHSDDPALMELFLEVMVPVVQQFPKPPTAHHAAQLIDRVIRLFRNLGQPSYRMAQGLWAEMLIIATARDPMTVAKAWRSTTFDTSDFATVHQRLEVKSTTGPIRSHAFSAEQLRLPAGVIGVVASLLCRRSTGGLSVGELWSMVRRQVAGDPDLLLTVDGIVAATLGSTWKEALQLRYDWHTAKESVQFFSMTDVPAVGVLPISNVSEVKFRSDLSRCTPLGAAFLEQASGLLEAVSRYPAAPIT